VMVPTLASGLAVAEEEKEEARFALLLFVC
jgi:hypothetical protein